MPPDSTSLESGSWEITPTGFPHSDTCGLTLVWQLPARFRGLHRPSSPACPKASTSCPESLIITFFFSKKMMTLLAKFSLGFYTQSLLRHFLIPVRSRPAQKARASLFQDSPMQIQFPPDHCPPTLHPANAPLQSP
jgi:hypothetical protein